MASLSWLHLSDLHAARPQWDSGRVTATLIADLKRLAGEGLRPDFLFFTGDAAWGRAAGAAEEVLDAQFDLAAELLTAARRAFEPEIPLANVFLVPGNHDVDRTEVLDSQTAALDGMSLDRVHKWIESGNLEWRTAMGRLAAYRRFLERHGYEHLLGDPARLIYGCVREAAGVRVGIAGFNSAWSCCRDGENGKLWVGRAYQQGVLREPLREAEFRIALVHHPPGWLVEHEKTDFARQVRQDFKFLLHGHEHQDWVEPPEGGGCVTVAAAACYERSDRKNGYNLVRLDLASGQGEVWLRQFERDGGGWVKRTVSRWAEDGVWQVEVKGAGRDRAQAAAGRARGSGRPASPPPAPATDLERDLRRDVERDLGRYLERLRGVQPLPADRRLRDPRPAADHARRGLRPAARPGAAPGLREGAKGLGAAWQPERLERESDVPLDAVFPLAIANDRRGAVVLGDPERQDHAAQALRPGMHRSEAGPPRTSAGPPSSSCRSWWSCAACATPPPGCARRSPRRWGWPTSRSTAARPAGAGRCSAATASSSWSTGSTRSPTTSSGRRSRAGWRRRSGSCRRASSCSPAALRRPSEERPARRAVPGASHPPTREPEEAKRFIAVLVWRGRTARRGLERRAEVARRRAEEGAAELSARLFEAEDQRPHSCATW